MKWFGISLIKRNMSIKASGYFCIHNRLGKKRQKISIGEDVGQSKPYMLRVTVSK